MKQRLIVSARGINLKQYRGKEVQFFIDRTWDLYGQDIKSHGSTGAPITKGEFSEIFKSFLREEKTNNPEAKLSTQLKAALKKYDRSSLYRDAGERLRGISAEELFGDKETARRFRKLTGTKAGTFDMSKYQFSRRGTLTDGRGYTVYKYNSVYIVQLNSPLQSLVLTAAEYQQSEYNQ